jgi:hypothetical protein
MFRRVFLAAMLTLGLVSFASAATKADAFAKELKLKGPQKAEVETLFDEAQKQSAAIMQQVNAMRTNLLNLNVAGQDTAAAVKNLAALDAQLLGIEADTLTKVLAKADPKQRSKAPKLFDMMSGMFQAGDWRKVN